MPQPQLFKDMTKATARIIEAINKKEKIILIGDYDVDGVISTSIMKIFFKHIKVDIDWIIPNRFTDGYGLSPKIIDRVKNYNLIITVDNGISAVYAAKLCKDYGIDLIITDHHLIGDRIPDAHSIIDQKQDSCKFPYSEICGAQIAWYLIASLNSSLKADFKISSLIQFVSIAIIADMMPLQHINRAMVIYGLKSIKNSTFPSIMAIRKKLNKNILKSDDIGFQIAPILNSSGRMKDAKYSVNFILSDDLLDAEIKLQNLSEINQDRKDIEAFITLEAIKKVNENDSILILNGENWHEGVVGIVAARISRKFKKPTIILTQDKNHNLKGSGRSLNNCNLFEITNENINFLNRFGGHHSAIGLSLDNEKLNDFKENMQISYLQRNYKEDDIDYDILGNLDFEYITFKLMDIINIYEPYGHHNSRPKFITYNVNIDDILKLGKDKEHIKFIFSQNNIALDGILFKTTQNFNFNQKVIIIYTLNINYFNNRKTLQLMIEEIISSTSDLI